MKMQLDKSQVIKFVNMKRSAQMQKKAKFVVLTRRRATGMDQTITFDEAKEMIEKDNFYVEVE